MSVITSLLKYAFYAVAVGYAINYFNSDPPYDQKEIDGANVIVTGASSGIGRALAKRYCQLGANVFITARRETRLLEVIKDCKGFGKQRKYGFVAADMSKMADTENVIKEAVRLFSKIDILILNHALPETYIPYQSKSRTFKDTVSKFDRMMEVNVRSNVYLMAHAWQHLTETARIIVSGSVAGVFYAPILRDYGASKWALRGYFQNIMSELRLTKSKRSMTHVLLAGVDTEMGRYEQKDLGIDDNLYKTLYAGGADDAAEAIINGAGLRKQDVWYVPAADQYYYFKYFNVMPEWVQDYVDWETGAQTHNLA